MDDDGGLLVAAGVSVTACEHGVLYLLLHDAEGRPFAVAPLEVPAACTLVRHIGEAAAKRLAAGADSIGEVAGHG